MTEIKKTRSVVANLHYAGDYREILEEAQRSGECPFCRPAFQKKAVYKTYDWLTAPNQFPIKDSEGSEPAYHFLLLPKRHTGDFTDLTPSDWSQMLEMIGWIRYTYQIPGAGLVHRLGDPLWSGSTIIHVHFHLVVPRVIGDPKCPGAQKAISVYIPIG